MKAVWTNFAKVFPEYAGGDSIFGTNANGAKTLFYQGKAAMMINMASGIVEYNNDMKALDSGEEVENSEGNAIENVQKFTLGTFNMPSMEGDAFEAKARTIEVSNGFVGCISKDQAHDDKVVDFLMYYSSSEGQSVYIDAGLEDDMVPAGMSLVYNVSCRLILWICEVTFTYTFFSHCICQMAHNIFLMFFCPCVYINFTSK